MILLTGGGGQLGQELQKLRPYLAPRRGELELTDPDQVQRYLGTHAPELVVHAAAYTDTLKPELDPAEAIKCYASNALGTRNLVKFATCPIIYISTESAVHPYNFYILTKIAGENEVAKHKYGYRILRTSFRCDPFEYAKACTDMYTLADTVEKIAPLIDSTVGTSMDNAITYVGTGVRTVYALACQTRPDVEPVSRELFGLPSMVELLDV